MMVDRAHFSWVEDGRVLEVAAGVIRGAARVGARGLRLWDSELGGFASDCVALQCAGFLNRLSVSGSDDLSSLSGALLAGVYSRREDDDWFAIPYNSLVGSCGEMDIAEIGASAHALRSFHGGALHDLAAAISESSTTLVRDFAVPSSPGRYRKSAKAGDQDVLNADLYAALVVDTARQFSGRVDLGCEVAAVVGHLIREFGAHRNERWVYSVTPEGKPVLGYSAAYQATIVGWGWFLAASLEPTLRDAWTDVLIRAHIALREDLRSGPNEATESALWARNWLNVWEIRLAVASESALDPGERGLVTVGGHRITDATHLERAFEVNLPVTQGRHPVSTSFRKVANFCAILCALDDLKVEKETYR